MQTTSRFLLLGLFAAAGAGLALWVGLSADTPSTAVKARADAQRAPTAIALHRASAPRSASLAAQMPRMAPEPHSPMLVAPSLLYARQATPPLGNTPLPSRLESLRKGPTRRQADVAAPAAASPTPNPLEGETMAGWLIDALENATPDLPEPPDAPDDPSVLGRRHDLVQPLVLK